MFACVFCLLTVDVEGDGSSQVRFEVVKVEGGALVHAAVAALDGLERQEAAGAGDGIVLKTGGQRRRWSVTNIPLNGERVSSSSRKTNKHAPLCGTQTRAAGFRQSRTSW